jgi:superfamily II DNA or RNA helicase
VYGDAGSVVHNAIEDYINKGESTFEQHWKNYNIDGQTGFYNKKLDKQKYLKMYERAVQYLSTLGSIKTITTELPVVQQYGEETLKGFYDVHIVTRNGDVIILDWKTNSQCSDAMHKDQRLFYSFMTYREHKIFPTCRWIYLKTGKVFEDVFTEQDILKFKNDLDTFINNVNTWGNDITKYGPGDWKNPFNSHLDLCIQEVGKRMASPNKKITITNMGSYYELSGDLDNVLEEGIDRQTKFDLKDKYFMQQNAKKYARGYIDIKDVGTIHLYNKRLHCFPIGLLDTVKKIINDWRTHYKYAVDIIEKDCRDLTIVNKILPEYDNDFYAVADRPYQIEARKVFLEKERGIIQLPTGSGKTRTAVDIIKILQKQTLWICDRKELVAQTKKVMEENLPFKVGTISAGVCETQHPVTIATIQSLMSKKSELTEFFNNINFVVVDEYHKGAAESYQKMLGLLVHANYRLGLTATPFRDDKKEPILFGLIGPVIYEVSTKELIDAGYLTKPKIVFHKVESTAGDNYPDDYRVSVTENDNRNNLINTIHMQTLDKKKIILVKHIKHGELLSKTLGCRFIHGSLPSITRKSIFDEFIKCNWGTLIITQSIAAEGIDIPDLEVIINAAANAGDVKSIQTLGRVLRLFKDKEAVYHDFLDGGSHTHGHSVSRINAFKNQEHNVEVKE